MWPQVNSKKLARVSLLTLRNLPTRKYSTRGNAAGSSGFWGMVAPSEINLFFRNCSPYFLYKRISTHTHTDACLGRSFSHKYVVILWMAVRTRAGRLKLTEKRNRPHPRAQLYPPNLCVDTNVLNFMEAHRATELVFCTECRNKGSWKQSVRYRAMHQIHERGLLSVCPKKNAVSATSVSGARCSTSSVSESFSWKFRLGCILICVRS